MRMQVPSLSSLRGLRIWHCCKLWQRLQMQLGSHIAEAVAVVWVSSCSSDSTPSQELPYAVGVALKRKKKKSILKKLMEWNRVHLIKIYLIFLCLFERNLELIFYSERNLDLITAFGSILYQALLTCRNNASGDSWEFGARQHRLLHTQHRISDSLTLTKM